MFFNQAFRLGYSTMLLSLWPRRARFLCQFHKVYTSVVHLSWKSLHFNQSRSNVSEKIWEKKRKYMKIIENIMTVQTIQCLFISSGLLFCHNLNLSATELSHPEGDLKLLSVRLSNLIFANMELRQHFSRWGVRKLMKIVIINNYVVPLAGLTYPPINLKLLLDIVLSCFDMFCIVLSCFVCHFNIF